MKSKRFWITCALAITVTLAVSSITGATVHPPDVNPADFTCSGVTNPFFPLEPGTIWTYEGESEGVSTTNTVEVTCDTLEIEIKNDAGDSIGSVVTTVVHDTAFEGGVLVEETSDFFAIACDGTVWYFGEDTMEFNPPSTEGTWREGVDDADAGFIMLAKPMVGDRYFQEFAPKVAVDLAKVLTLDGSATTLFTGLVDNLLVTKETSQLDPGVVENKFYASGIGFIRGEIIKGGDEFTELETFTPGSGCGP